MGHRVVCCVCESYHSDSWGGGGISFFVTDSGEYACESCLEDSFCIDKTANDKHIVYTISMHNFAEVIKDACYELELELDYIKAEYRKEQLDDTEYRYTFNKEQVTMYALSGFDIDNLMQNPVI